MKGSNGFASTLMMIFMFSGMVIKDCVEAQLVYDQYGRPITGQNPYDPWTLAWNGIVYDTRNPNANQALIRDVAIMQTNLNTAVQQLGAANQQINRANQEQNELRGTLEKFVTPIQNLVDALSKQSADLKRLGDTVDLSNLPIPQGPVSFDFGIPGISLTDVQVFNNLKTLAEALVTSNDVHPADSIRLIHVLKPLIELLQVSFNTESVRTKLEGLQRQLDAEKASRALTEAQLEEYKKDPLRGIKVIVKTFIDYKLKQSKGQLDKSKETFGHVYLATLNLVGKVVDQAKKNVDYLKQIPKNFWKMSENVITKYSPGNLGLGLAVKFAQTPTPLQQAVREGAEKRSRGKGAKKASDVDK